MKMMRIGLAAALALVVMAPASMAYAAKKPAAGGIDAKARTKGMAEAPALAVSAGLTCTVTDARFIGADKKSGQDFYEIACEPGIGGVLAAKKEEAKPAFFNCLETGRPTEDGKPSSLACILPGNADPVQSLATFVAKSGTACVIDKARAIGASPTNTFFEVACKDGSGFILMTSAPANADQDVKANTCLAYEPGGTLFCELTSRDAQLAVVDRLNAAANKGCKITDRRYVLSATTGSTYYEVACENGKGYLLEQGADGALARAIDCVNAVGGGECTLTDAREAKTEQAGLYSRLATKAGFPCKVEKYALFPTRNAGEEVVELKCSDRPDGAVAIFDANGGGKAFSCIVSDLQGYGCSFTPKSASVGKLSADLKSFGKGSCVVSDARVIGKTGSGDGFIEVACADGLPGWVINYADRSNTPKELLSCTQASGIGGGCKLPTNQKK